MLDFIYPQPCVNEECQADLLNRSFGGKVHGHTSREPSRWASNPPQHTMQLVCTVCVVSCVLIPTRGSILTLKRVHHVHKCDCLSDHGYFTLKSEAASYLHQTSLLLHLCQLLHLLGNTSCCSTCCCHPSVSPMASILRETQWEAGWQPPFTGLTAPHNLRPVSIVYIPLKHQRGKV
jgi:hypothetical protein